MECSWTWLIVSDVSDSKEQGNFLPFGYANFGNERSNNADELQVS